MDILTRLGILTVATNKYVEYWKDQARSISDSQTKGLDITLHVFTDDTQSVDNFSNDLNIKVISHEIPSLGWPEATLMRYSLFTEFRDEIREEVLMHLDADMLLHEPLKLGDLVDKIQNGICLVQHPGYYRPRGFGLIKLYATNFRTAVMDLYLFLKLGGLGLWETRENSSAFVHRSMRKTYFCGGTWWGYRSNILQLCEDLAARIEKDLVGQETAVWHDESHLNWWASRNHHGSTGPEYCYAVGYPQLKDLKCIIEAVHK